MIFDFDFAIRILPALAQAAVTTVKITLLGYALASVIGLLAAIGRLHGPGWLKLCLLSAMEFVRGTPLLLQIFFLYMVAPEYGLILSPTLTGVLAIGIHYGAYLSEVYRSGLASIPRGQVEAAAALGFRAGNTLRLVVLPQALPPIIPALGNYLLAMFKETPLLSTISILELMSQAKQIGSETFRYIEPVTLVGGFFLGMSLVGAALTHMLERRMALVQ